MAMYLLYQSKNNLLLVYFKYYQFYVQIIYYLSKLVF